MYVRDPWGGDFDRLAGWFMRIAEITEAAADLFFERGSHRTSMSDIAESVAIQKPSLYHYFRTKATILFRIHETAMEHLIERQRGREGQGLSPSSVLFEVIVDNLELIAQRGRRTRAFAGDRNELTPEQRSEIERMHQQYLSMVESVVKDGVELGLFRVTDVRTATLGMFGMWNWAYTWINPDEMSPPCRRPSLI